jgi:hypothetical protein
MPPVILYLVEDVVQSGLLQRDQENLRVLPSHAGGASLSRLRRADHLEKRLPVRRAARTGHPKAFFRN